MKQFLIEKDLWNDLKLIQGIEPVEELIKMVELWERDGEKVYIDFDIVREWMK